MSEEATMQNVFYFPSLKVSKPMKLIKSGWLITYLDYLGTSYWVLKYCEQVSFHESNRPGKLRLNFARDVNLKSV